MEITYQSLYGRNYPIYHLSFFEGTPNTFVINIAPLSFKNLIERAIDERVVILNRTINIYEYSVDDNLLMGNEDNFISFAMGDEAPWNLLDFGLTEEWLKAYRELISVMTPNKIYGFYENVVMDSTDKDDNISIDALQCANGTVKFRSNGKWFYVALSLYDIDDLFSLIDIIEDY